MTKPLIIMFFGLTLLLSECWPRPKSNQTPTPLPSPAPTTSVKITQPAEGTKVEQTEMVKGTSQRIPSEQVIWVVVFVHKVGRYYPQNNPADVQPSGDWASVTYIGVQADVGLKFDLIAVLADKEAQSAFNKYLVDARDKNNYIGLQQLPNGATIYDRVSTTRKY